MRKRFLKCIDLYNASINFTYKGSQSYKTELGGVLTIITLIIILFNSWIMGRDIYLRNNPIVIQTDEMLSLYPNKTIDLENFFFGYFLSDVLNNKFDDKSVVEVEALQYIMWLNGNGNQIAELKNLELTNCKAEILKYQYSFPMNPKTLNDLECIKDLNSTIGGFWTEEYLSCIYFRVKACKNDTEKNDMKCRPQEEIEKIIPTLYFNFFYKKVLLDLKNFTHPFKYAIAEDWFTLSYSTLKTIDYYFDVNLIKTDTGLVFNGEDEIQETLGYYLNKGDFQPVRKNEDSPYVFSTSIYMSNHQNTYSRQYIKLQQIFANLGGIFQFVLLCFKIIFIPYIKKRYYLKIMEKLYDFSEEKLDPDILYINEVRKKFSTFQERLSVKTGKPNYAGVVHNQSDSKFSPVFFKSSSLKSKFELNQQSKNLKFSSDRENHLDTKIKNMLSQKRKLVFKPVEMILTIYCISKCRNKRLNGKAMIYNSACQNVHKNTDLMTHIESIQDLTKMKYLFFNSEQLLSIPYLSKPTKFNSCLFHEVENYAKAFDHKANEKDNILLILNYFKTKIRKNSLDSCDIKILEILDHHLKNLLEE